ncbi:MAG: hypothetical protein FJ207_13280 [Gemmatimonadetes bacterium]|nr:hypothetical protein [Gemmatimonadota bacterium]
MFTGRYSRSGTALAVAALLIAGHAQAQTLVESSLEARFQLDLAVPQAALMRMMPAGFTTNVATQGAAKDANLRVIFIERLTINDAEGRSVGDGSNLLVYLTVPSTDPSGQNAQVVIGGITEDPADAPGPFGVYLPATTHSLHRETASGSGPIVETQDWVFTAAGGERLEMHITFERGVANRGAPRETRFYSGKNPGTVEISRQQQVLDILRNVTTNPRDRVRSFSFTAGGGSYAALFDGTERVLSWDNIVWMNRDVMRP